MNQKEQEITTKILQEISTTGKDHRAELLDQYRTFLQAVAIRVNLETQERVGAYLTEG